MKKMIMHIASVKVQKVADAMGVEELGVEGAYGAVMGAVFVLVGLAMCWVVC